MLIYLFFLKDSHGTNKKWINQRINGEQIPNILVMKANSLGELTWRAFWDKMDIINQLTSEIYKPPA